MVAHDTHGVSAGVQVLFSTCSTYVCVCGRARARARMRLALSLARSPQLPFPSSLRPPLSVPLPFKLLLTLQLASRVHDRLPGLRIVVPPPPGRAAFVRNARTARFAVTEDEEHHADGDGDGDGVVHDGNDQPSVSKREFGEGDVCLAKLRDEAERERA